MAISLMMFKILRSSGSALKRPPASATSRPLCSEAIRYAPPPPIRVRVRSATPPKSPGSQSGKAVCNRDASRA